MTTYRGNEKVQPGLYLNIRQLSFKSISEKPAPLPGTSEDVYHRVPMLVMLVSAPVLGLVYVMFLPFIGFAMVTYLLGTKAVQLVAGVASDAVRVLRPGWEPSLAFFSRPKPTKTSETPTESVDEWAEDVEKKINETDRHA
jgi:hypothetical protein